jgi:hypothetical protein
VTTGIDMLRIEDGRIAEAWVSWDTLGLVEQLTDLGDEPDSGFLAVLEKLRTRA